MATVVSLSSGEQLRVSDQKVNGERMPISYEEIKSIVQGRSGEPWVELYNDDAGPDSDAHLVNLNTCTSLDPNG